MDHCFHSWSAPPFPVGRGLLDTSWGEGESLVVGNCRVQCEIPALPQSSLGCSTADCQQAKAAGTCPGRGAAGISPSEGARGRAGCCSLSLEQGSCGLACAAGRAKDCCWASWILHLLERPCPDMILCLPSSWELPLFLPWKWDRFCGVTWGNACSTHSALGLGALPSTIAGCGADWAGHSDLHSTLWGQGESLTLSEPLDFCGWCSCGGCRINSPLGDGQGCTAGKRLQKDPQEVQVI